jgi:ubiquinone/menaquinone biosynthesis C-methylase UbiE
MKLGIIPEGILERMALGAGLVPTPLVLSFWGMGLARCLLAGVRLGVFEALAQGEKTAPELAGALGCDPAGIETLLNALNGFGYLQRRAGRFSNRKISRKWLLKTSPSSMHDAVVFFSDLWDRLGHLEGAVKTGRLELLHDRTEPDFWERYLRGLAAFARAAGGEVVRKVKLAAAPKRLLDVGGGHGLYSAAFCRKYPGLEAEVLDLAPALEQGKRIVAEAGFADRVRYRAGDLRQDDWGEGYDLVLIFNVIHNTPVSEAPEVLKRAFRALRPGGMLALMDSEHREHRGDVSSTGGFNELFFFLVSGARAYPEELMRKWMKAAGFPQVRTARLRFAPAALLTGTRPG